MYHQKDHTITTDETETDEKILGGVGWVLFKYMTIFKDNTAEIDATTGKSIKYGELLRNSIRTSIKLKQMGVKKGDIITYYSEIHLNSGVPVIASLLMGSVTTFIDICLPVPDVLHLLNQVKPKMLLTDPQYVQKLRDIVKDYNTDTKIVVFDEDFFKYTEEEEYFKPIYVNNLQEQAFIYFSSGTTGLPKGICLNHYNLSSLEIFEDSNWIEGQMKVIYSNDSFYWGIEMLRFISAVRQGICRLVDSEEFDPKKVWQILEKYKVNVAYLIPYHIALMCNAGKPENLHLSSLTTIYCEGGTLPSQYKLLIQDILPNTDIFPLYGQTEAGPLLSLSKCDLHRKYNRAKSGCTGTPMTGVGNCFKVVDLESGKSLGPNREGELCIKSKNAMIGYYNLDFSDRFDQEGWLRTGDLAYYDEDLCFFVTGRCKELIIYQGWHITPATFEIELLNFPGVVKAAVVGVPHIEDGERPLGVIMVDEDFAGTAKEIEKYVQEKIPDRPLKVKIVPEIPATPTGKVKRVELKRKVLAGEI